jgi:hypothetical protein
MADTTTRYGFPFQEATDPPDGASLGQDLAEAVDTALGTVEDAADTRLDALEAADTALDTRVDVAELKLPRYVVKANATARTSTITLAADSGTGQVLAGIPLEVGTYEIELVALFTTAATAAGFQTRWAFSGTVNGTSSYRACVGPADPATSIQANSLGNFVTVQLTGQSANYFRDSAAAYGSVREIAANVVVTVAGNLSLNWAQAVSNASATTLREGSYFRITRYA